MSKKRAAAKTNWGKEEFQPLFLKIVITPGEKRSDNAENDYMLGSGDIAWVPVVRNGRAFCEAPATEYNPGKALFYCSGLRRYCRQYFILAKDRCNTGVENDWQGLDRQF